MSNQVQDRLNAKLTNNRQEGIIQYSTFNLEQTVLFNGTLGGDPVTHESGAVQLRYSLDVNDRSMQIFPADLPASFWGAEWQSITPLVNGNALPDVPTSQTMEGRTIDVRSIEALKSIGYKKDCGCKK